MNRGIELENALAALSQKGTEVGYTETEIDDFLEDIDYDTLLQAIWNNAETVYAYRADGKHTFSMDYRGTELFKQRATLLYDDMGGGCAGTVIAARSMELWLLEDIVLATLKSTGKNRTGGKIEEEKEKKEPKYTQKFKEQMVVQYKSGTPARELVQRYGMSKSTLHKWIGDYTRSGSFHAKDSRSPEENELIMLRKELKKLRMENDILKQAALIMAKK